MLRNSIRCSHCGKTFIQKDEQTPLVNRSDGVRFHIALFAGPDLRPKFPQGFYDDQVVCSFVHTHSHFRPHEDTVLVVITQADKEPGKVLQQMENVADRLAKLVEQGEKLSAVYTFNSWKLTAGFPI